MGLSVKNKTGRSRILKGAIFFFASAFASRVCLSATTRPTPAPSSKTVDSATWMTINKGAMIRVDKYDPNSNTYKVTVIGEEAVGPLYTRFEEIAKAVSFSEVARLKKKPSLIVGNEYQVDTPLPALTAAALAKRKSDLQKH
jgi:hypothetical protein